MTDGFSRFSVPDYLTDPEMAFEYIKALEEEIEAQAKRIAELEVTAQFVEEYTKEAGRLDTRIAELEAALKPFAYYAEQIPNDVSDTASASGTVGDLRTASKVLGEKE